MEEIELVYAVHQVEKEAHEAYLKTWSIITEGAENNGKYSNELLYQVIENQQKIASDLGLLATLTRTLIESIEKQTGTTIKI